MLVGASMRGDGGVLAVDPESREWPSAGERAVDAALREMRALGLMDYETSGGGMLRWRPTEAGARLVRERPELFEEARAEYARIVSGRD